MIEPLEQRIAPAAVYTFTDVDGDVVTVKSSKGSSADFKNLMDFHRVAQGAGYKINEIDLTDVVPGSLGEFSNTDLSITIVRGPAGDGHVDIGVVTAGAMPIHSLVAPHASILELDCGDGTHAIGLLAIASYGTAAPAYFVGGAVESIGTLKGSVGSIRIAGDIGYGGILIEGAAPGSPAKSVGSVYVGGNLQGGVSDAITNAGELLISALHTGSVSIRGSVVGGAIDGNPFFFPFNGSGALEVISDAVSIGGSVIGGTGISSGILLGNVGVVSVRGSFVGGSNDGAGSFFGAAGSFTVGGNVIGGTHPGAGTLIFEAARTVVVKGSIMGGVTDTSGMSSTGAGAIDISGNVASVSVGGDVIAGAVTAGNYNFNGSITGAANVGKLHIGGSLLGSNANRAQILFKGAAPAKPGSYNAIGSLAIGGSVEYGIIASGHDAEQPAGKTPTTIFNLGDSLNPDAGIGAVTIGGDYYHSSILAATNDNDGMGAGRFNAGKNYDTQSIGVPADVARLGPVVIKGSILDDYHSTADSGFEAEQIQSISAAGVTIYKHGAGLRFFDPNQFVFAEEIMPV